MNKLSTRRYSVLLLAVVLGSTGTVRAAENSTPGSSCVGKPIADFTLRDYRGLEHSLSDYQKRE